MTRKTQDRSSGPKRQLKASQFSLKPGELRKLIYAAESPRDRCLIRTLAETGIRRAELAALDVRDVDLEVRRLTIRSGKGGKERVVPITQELASDLRFLIGRKQTGPIFVSLQKGPLQIRQINRVVRALGEAAGVKNPNPASGGAVTCHLFRHSFARLWKQRGGDIESLSHILGHSSSATTVDLYGTQSIDDVHANYERIMEDSPS